MDGLTANASLPLETSNDKKCGEASAASALVADINPILAGLLAAHLSLSADLVTESSCDVADGLVPNVARLRPRLVIVDPTDLRLRPDRDLSDVIEEIKKISSNTLFLAYSIDTGAPMIRALLTAGFRGFVSKTSAMSSLNLAVRAVLDGGIYFDPTVSHLLAPVFFGAAPTVQSHGDVLSSREKLVLIQLARGLRLKEVAADLDLSCKTIETYKARAKKKIGLKNSREIYEYVSSQDWLE